MKSPLSVVRSLATNKLVLSSAVLFVATFAGNILNAAYNFAMARFLGPSDYGELMAIISVLYILTFPSVVINNIVTRFAAVFSSRDEFPKLHFLFVTITTRILMFGGILIVLFLVFGKTIAGFFNINQVLALILTAILAVVMFLITVNFGALTGVLKFKSVAFANLFWPLTRLVLSISFVLMGFSVTGAISGFLISSIATYLVSLYPLKFLLHYKEKETHLKDSNINQYAFPASISILGLTLLVNTDILMVKAFFSTHDAGIYAACSLLAKVIFFFALPLITMVFPIITRKFESGEQYKKLFALTLGTVALFSTGISVLYALFPSLFISVIFGAKFNDATPYLAVLGVFISLYSINYLFSTFWLSIGKMLVSSASLLAGILQAILIAFSHQSLFDVIRGSIIASALLLLYNGIYYVGFMKQGSRQ